MSKYEQKVSREVIESHYKNLKLFLGRIAKRIELMGSYRRGKSLIGDLDVAVELRACVKEDDVKQAVEQVFKYSKDFEVTSGGNKHITLHTALAGIRTQLDLYFFKRAHWGPASLFLTGSGQHNQQMRSYAKSKGWKLNQYGLFDEDGNRLDKNTERSIYKELGLPYVKPEDRKGEDELGLGKKVNKSIVRRVRSSDGKRYYTVKNGTCTCPGYKHRKFCRHLNLK